MGVVRTCQQNTSVPGQRLCTHHYLFILQGHVIAFLNPDSTGIQHLLPSRVEKGRRFVTFRDACTTSSGARLYGSTATNDLALPFIDETGANLFL